MSIAENVNRTLKTKEPQPLVCGSPGNEQAKLDSLPVNLAKPKIKIGGAFVHRIKVKFRELMMAMIVEPSKKFPTCQGLIAGLGFPRGSRRSRSVSPGKSPPVLTDRTNPDRFPGCPD